MDSRRGFAPTIIDSAGKPISTDLSGPSAKDPVEVLVIARVEKPSAN
jgi:hypothetical protein